MGIIYTFRKRRRNSFNKNSEDLSRSAPVSPSNPNVHFGAQTKGPTVEATTHTNKGFVCEAAGSDKVCETSLSR